MSDTLGIYDRMAGDYRDMAAAGKSPGRDLFLAALPEAARVLDLGCGPGLDAAVFAAAGHRVLAVDGSAEMVALAAAHPGVTARQALFDDVPDFGSFDGIWASFSLLHAGRADLPRHLQDLRAACRDGAVFGLSMKLGTGEGPDGLGRFYTYYEEDVLRDLLARAGFVPVDARSGVSAGLAGERHPWLFLLSRA